jgi:hypothetical protein
MAYDSYDSARGRREVVWTCILVAQLAFTFAIGSLFDSFTASFFLASFFASLDGLVMYRRWIQ